MGTRELQVIVEGLKDPQDEDKVIEQVKTVLDGLECNHKYDRVWTYADPSKIGVVQFKSMASKIGFLRRVNNIETKWKNGDDMRFKSNDTIEKRIVDKTMGFIKYHLRETGKHPLKSIIIKWKKNIVEVNGKEAARVNETGDVVYETGFTDIKDAVASAIGEWKERRGLG